MSVSPAQLPIEDHAADPVSAYRVYLAAIARRDFAAVTQMMSEDYARPLRDLRGNRDFAPLFELWCESQSVPVVIMASRVQGDSASLRTRSGKALGKVELCRDGARWRIAAETHDE
jgi:ketosteroid isomerase-like protein